MARKPAPQAVAGGVAITDKQLRVDALTPDPKNARKHPEVQIAQIAKAIEEFGVVDKTVVRPNGQIIGGEGRWLALKRLGHDEVDCRIIAGLAESQYRRLALALNKIGDNSRWDDDVLAQLLGELREEGDPLDGIGFSDREIEKLLAGDDPIEVREIETSDVEDECWISVRGPLAQQAQVLKALQDVMKKFPGVAVDLGTIAIG